MNKNNPQKQQHLWIRFFFFFFLRNKHTQERVKWIYGFEFKHFKSITLKLKLKFKYINAYYEHLAIYILILHLTTVLDGEQGFWHSCVPFLLLLSLLFFPPFFFWKCFFLLLPCWCCFRFFYFYFSYKLIGLGLKFYRLVLTSQEL